MNQSTDTHNFIEAGFRLKYELITHLRTFFIPVLVLPIYKQIQY